MSGLHLHQAPIVNADWNNNEHMNWFVHEHIERLSSDSKSKIEIHIPNPKNIQSIHV